MESSSCSMAWRCIFPPMDFRYFCVSNFRDQYWTIYLTQTFRSITMLVISWALIISALHTQRLNHRSIALKSLWARGFGKITADQIVNLKQPTVVRFLFLLTSNAVSPLIRCVLGDVGYFRQCHDGQYFPSICFFCLRCVQWSRIVYADGRWMVRLRKRSKNSARLRSSGDTALKLWFINASFLWNTYDDHFLSFTLACFSMYLHRSDQ